MELAEIIQSFTKSFTQIQNEYGADFNSIAQEDRIWLGNLEDKTQLLKSAPTKTAIDEVIRHLKSPDYLFSFTDIESLSKFTSSINTIVRIVNRINNFKQETEIDGGNLNLPDLFNTIKITESLGVLSYTLNSNLKAFIPHLFSVVKHCQNPTEYPIFYKFWKNISGKVFNVDETYDSLCAFYRTIPADERHLNFGCYLGTIGINLAKQINNYEIIKSEGDKNYRFVKNELINIDKYFSLITNYERHPNFYIIGSKYSDRDNSDVFPEMMTRSVVSTGFASQIDLVDYVGQDEDTIKQYLTDQGESSKSRNALKIFLNLKVGDKVAIKSDGSPKDDVAFLSIVGIAEVIEKDGEIYQFEPDGLGHEINVKFIAAPVHKEFNLGYGRTIHRLSNREHIDLIFNAEYGIINEASSVLTPSKNNHNTILMNKNIIFYGPPGTGKTYSTIDKACEILGFQPTTDVTGEELRKSKKDFFNKHLGEQIEFVTFHQSMSYEDFIEGIKPRTSGVDNDSVIYETVPGVFTRISFRALKNIYKNCSSKFNSPSLKSFEAIYSDFIKYIQELSQTNSYPFKTISGSQLKFDKMSTDNTMIVFFEFSNSAKKSGPGTEPFRVRMEKIKSLYENKVPKIVKNLKLEVAPFVKYNETVYYAVYKKFLDFIDEKDPSYAIQERSQSEEVDLAGLELTHSRDYEKLLNRTADLLEGEDKNSVYMEPYILIIDEINRGNVSQIFGELITLLEEDKRFLSKEELKLSLAYSGSEFTVPPNLYIIGTMNTADRSVEALDTALRRRFSFTEMAPEHKHKNISTDIIINNKHFNFQEILETINKRLEKLIGRDHKIGHSYFMINDEDATWSFYSRAFCEKILPLLQEYFYGDYSKICLVLGKGFIKELPAKFDNKFFADADYDDIELLQERKIWQIEKIENDIKFENALTTLLNR